MKIHKINIDKDRIDVVKGFFGYRVVYPVKDENGKIIWMNLLFGGKENLFKLIFILIIIGLALYGVNEMITGCREMAKNPCDYCQKNSNINISTFIIERGDNVGNSEQG